MYYVFIDHGVMMAIDKGTPQEALETYAETMMDEDDMDKKVYITDKRPDMYMVQMDTKIVYEFIKEAKGREEGW